MPIKPGKMRKRAHVPRRRTETPEERVKVEISAGGIVFKRTPKGVRIAFVMDPYGKWAFAKGHAEQGEAIVDAAVRETKEEMGLGTLKVIAPLGTIDFWFRDRYREETKGVLIHKYVHYFLMQTRSRAKGSPQRKEKIRSIIWVGLRNAFKTSSYDDVRPILQKAIELLSQKRDGRPATPQRHGKQPQPHPQREERHSRPQYSSSSEGGDIQL